MRPEDTIATAEAAEAPGVRRRVSVVLSINDAEAVALAALARRAGAEIVDLALDWGEGPAAALAALSPAALADTVILVETPAPEIEDRLRRAGRTVYVVDHHLYVTPAGALLDRRGPRSSIEQAAALLGVALAREEAAIAANDRGFYPELFAHFRAGGLDAEAALAETRALRRRELAIRRLVAARHPGTGPPDPGPADLAAAEAELAAAAAWYESAFAERRAVRLAPRRGAVQDDPELILLHAPRRLAPVLADAAYLDAYRRFVSERGGEGEPPRLDLLMLFADDEAGREAAPAAILFSGRGERVPLLEQFLARCREERRGPAPAFYAGGGGATCFLGMEATALAPAERSALADALLAELGLGWRPLARWRTQFLQVLDTNRRDRFRLAPAATAVLEPLAADDQERAYFHAYLRDRLTPPAERMPVRADAELEARDYVLRSWRVRLSPASLRLEFPAGGRVLAAQIESVAVHLAYYGIVVLEWSCAGAPFDAGGGALWQGLLAGFPAAADGRIATLGELLDFNDYARHCFSSYANPWRRCDVTLRLDEAGGPVEETLQFGAAATANAHRPAGWFKLLVERALAPFGVTPDELELLLDERAHLVAGAALAGPQPRLADAVLDADNMLARLAGADEYGAHFFYSVEFARAELERWRYRRFADVGTHYAFSGHALAMLGYGGFAADVVLGDDPDQGHLSRMYRRLVVVNLVYRAVFGVLSRAIVEVAQQRVAAEAATPRAADAATRARRHARLDEITERTRRLRSDLVGFANAFWFEDVSSQMQGRELFDLIRGMAPAKPLYDELMQEVERADTLEQSERIERQAERSRNVRTIAVFAGAFALGVATITLLFGQAAIGWRLPLLGVVFLASAIIAVLQWHSTVPTPQQGSDLGSSARNLASEVRAYLAPAWSWVRQRARLQRR